MSEHSYTYAIVGGGLAGASAVQGIREYDKDGSILLISDEKHLPYDRPPLSKKLWFGKKKLEEIFIHDEAFYNENRITLQLDAKVKAINTNYKMIGDDNGNSYYFEKLLLATGGTPNRLQIPGGEFDGVCYYRYLDDYLKIRNEVSEGKSAVVIGGGFIGSELAAALSINKVEVFMIFPDPYLVSRVFPDYLGQSLQRHYLTKGINIYAGDKPSLITKNGDKFITETEGGVKIESDIVIVGVGITPETKLARAAGLQIGNGVIVNEFLQTSHPDIYAAGDNAFFPYQALGKQMRVEHWDNALNQGKYAGWNMAGAKKSYTYMPYFFSDLFEFGYEAVGEVNAELETFPDWQSENDTGVIYYLKDNKLRGVMMCNVWDKVDAARELIQKNETVSPESLHGAIQQLEGSTL